MKRTEQLIVATKDIWDAYIRHPFVQGIQNGTLDREKFRYYIMQDFLYLKDYAADNVILLETLDKLTEHYTEKQVKHLVDIFVACSRYELAFWQMSWERKK